MKKRRSKTVLDCPFKVKYNFVLFLCVFCCREEKSSPAGSTTPESHQIEYESDFELDKEDTVGFRFHTSYIIYIRI